MQLVGDIKGEAGIAVPSSADLGTINIDCTVHIYSVKPQNIDIFVRKRINSERPSVPAVIRLVQI